MPEHYTEFDRNNPLFERARVPCEFVQCGDPIKNNTAMGAVRTVHYTIRVISGKRPLPGGGGTERVVRFEISDECAHSGLGQPCSSMNRTNLPFASPLGASAQMQWGLQMPQMGMQRQHPPPMQRQHPYTTADIGSKSITDNAIPSSPINLFELEVGETDFGDLRRDQALLVDFNNFAESFISLLGYCDLGKEEEKEMRDLQGGPNFRPRSAERMSRNQNQPQSDSYNGTPCPPSTPYSGQVPKFTCRLEESSTAQHNGMNRQTKGPSQARFSVVESNQFRELSHLSLNLTKGTDSSIRTYLSSRLRQSMSDGANLNLRLSSQINRAEEAEQSLAVANNRYTDYIQSSEAEKRELRTEAGESMQRESIKREEEFNKKLQEKEEKIRTVKDQAETEKRESQAKMEELYQKLNVLVKEKSETESENQKLDATVKTLRDNLDASKKQLKALTEDMSLTEKSLHQTQLRVAALEQSNESQQVALEKADSLRRAAESGSARASESANENRSQLDQVQSKLSSAESELGKLRQLLDRYKLDRQESKKKMRGKVELIRKQEEALTEKEEEMADFERQMNEFRLEMETMRKDASQREFELKETKTKLVESTKVLESNQQVISWLNKEINSQQLGNGSSLPSMYGATGGLSTRNYLDGVSLGVGVAPPPSDISYLASGPMTMNGRVTPDLKGSNSLPGHAGTTLHRTTTSPFPYHLSGAGIPGSTRKPLLHSHPIPSAPPPAPTPLPTMSQVPNRSGRTHITSDMTPCNKD